MFVPAALYLALMSGQPGAHGWGTVMATDTAFVIGCLALFGSRIPPTLRLFLLSLAIFDDVGAILIVALGYGQELNWTALGLAMVGLAVVAGCARLGIRSIPIYFLIGGVIWLCFDASGIHPTITGVVLGLMTPTRIWVSDERLRAILDRVLSYPKGGHWTGNTIERRDLRRAGTAVTESLSPVERLEIMLHPWVGFTIMPIFALANAGIAISGADIGQPVSVAIFAGLVIGKPIGVLSFSWLAVRLGPATRAFGLSWPLLAAGGFLTGIGFTMSLFIAGLAYAPAMLNAAKIGILAGSAVSAAAGLLMLMWLASRKRTA
jgi:NhaA family Na+:H+ antiporter